MADTLLLTKAGPRLIDFCLDADELSIQANGPGMVFEKLELMTNRTALDGATVRFYQEVARGLPATVDCPHADLRQAAITVEPHRLGAEHVSERAASPYRVWRDAQDADRTCPGTASRELSTRGRHDRGARRRACHGAPRAPSFGRRRPAAECRSHPR